jgi:hypothetical protein
VRNLVDHWHHFGGSRRVERAPQSVCCERPVAREQCAIYNSRLPNRVFGLSDPHRDALTDRERFDAFCARKHNKCLRVGIPDGVVPGYDGRNNPHFDPGDNIPPAKHPNSCGKLHVNNPLTGAVRVIDAAGACL